MRLVANQPRLLVAVPLVRPSGDWWSPSGDAMYALVFSEKLHEAAETQIAAEE
jgi:hypothetical protein